MRREWRGSVGVLFVALNLCATNASADFGCLEPGKEEARYRFVYEGPVECSTREAVVEQVSLQLGKAWLASPGTKAGTIALAVEKEGNQYAAHMTMVDVHGVAASRDLEAAGCDAVLGDMVPVLVAAMESRLGPPPLCWEFGPAVGMATMTGLPAWNTAVVFGLFSPTSRRSLQLILGYDWPASGRANRDSTAALQFESYSARGEICPFSKALWGSLSIPICATAEGGFSRVSWAAGSGSSEAHPVLPWARLGIAVYARVNLGAVFLQLGANAGYLLARRQLWEKLHVNLEDDEVVVHELPELSLGGMASAGLRFQ